jgi:phage terminase small subunit
MPHPRKPGVIHVPKPPKEPKTMVNEDGTVTIVPPAFSPTYDRPDQHKVRKYKPYKDLKPPIYHSTGSRLTIMQQKFAVEYLVDKNATEAAIRAGYSPLTATVQASRLMTLPYIKEYIQTKLKQLENRTMITAEKVISNIEMVGNRCMKIEPVFDEAGNQIGEFRFDAANALRAQELLGRHLELFTDKVKQSGEVTLNVVIKEENVGKMEKKP